MGFMPPTVHVLIFFIGPILISSFRLVKRITNSSGWTSQQPPAVSPYLKILCKGFGICRFWSAGGPGSNPLWIEKDGCTTVGRTVNTAICVGELRQEKLSGLFKFKEQVSLELTSLLLLLQCQE